MDQVGIWNSFVYGIKLEFGIHECMTSSWNLAFMSVGQHVGIWNWGVYDIKLEFGIYKCITKLKFGIHVYRKLEFGIYECMTSWSMKFMCVWHQVGICVYDIKLEFVCMTSSWNLAFISVWKISWNLEFTCVWQVVIWHLWVMWCDVMHAIAAVCTKLHVTCANHGVLLFVACWLE